MLLQKPEAIARVVNLHRVDGEGIAQAVRTDAMDAAGLGIHQLGQVCFLGALSDDLPSPVAVDAEDQSLAIFEDWTAARDELPGAWPGVRHRWEAF